MSYIERADEEIIAAIERWAARRTPSDQPFIGVGEREFTLQQWISALKTKDPFLAFHIPQLREQAKNNGCNLLAKFK
ncbi:MAG: hypothetical protein A3A28_01665 [Candidatus Sungbacteria bacterium RIFCSPLOWO2_01_FULL_47_32]|uniref:Uncharacterized protein n=1 Tax=Candidatus Sungbacteria bacterium RIFCSPHIGHO2_01_FULL_47_32 TaxID=1802264 RepID=A0A1G2K3U5_9BACT|nr:MAG: hypothetical protein A2633_03940 [Candidatus Sungbacteria bacterium RIFCSPHIGHO2_01_FULL_47_32]OGZ98521.1 MAG: hypothetical protein A3D57_00135 [Candidatus Sungbacteria bacterium RIFCSPHIGHO2_02_FULL_46_12]OHA05276.1 MAG: hypothetical protein A3A28_01665 [Candidatus Sungbacteria bacterium RIFCSPLOWO2_01_FULL_47_32]